MRVAFRFILVSTDEVYGSVEAPIRSSKNSPYAPNSPYAASKAAADHLARAFARTYGLPTITTHASNNYGPFQFPEKLIPLVIIKALRGEPIPIYGDGCQERDWLYVVDQHPSGFHVVLCDGSVRVIDYDIARAAYRAGANRKDGTADGQGISNEEWPIPLPVRPRG
jgi:dTDP-glucose 4,6-dehydratase